MADVSVLVMDGSGVGKGLGLEGGAGVDCGGAVDMGDGVIVGVGVAVMIFPVFGSSVSRGFGDPLSAIDLI